MTKKNLLKFEKRLLEEKMQMLRQRGFTGAMLLQPEKTGNSESDGNPLDTSDQGYDTYQREFASRLTSEQTRVMKEIDEALRRIENKSYGDCEKCGKPIVRLRLEIVPHTRYCAKCVRSLEANWTVKPVAAPARKRRAKKQR